MMHDSINWCEIPNIDIVFSMSFYDQRYPIDKRNTINYQTEQSTITAFGILHVLNTKTFTVSQINNR